MTDNPGIVDLPPDPKTFAFILRVRADTTPRRNRTVIDLEDVTAEQIWHFVSLEAAFAKIRSSLELHAGSQSQSDRPH